METIIVNGIEISKFDVTDSTHPIGYTPSELANLVSPVGFEPAEPNDIMYLFRKGLLPNVTMSGYVGVNGVAQVIGRITTYATKCRNDFHNVLLRPSGRAAFDFNPSTDNQRLYKLRWVKIGTHLPTISFFGLRPVRWNTFTDNLKIYLGYMSEPNIVPTVPIVPLISEMNSNYLFPENYDGYRIDLLLMDNPTIELMFDEDGMFYTSLTSHGRTIHENFIDASKLYTIVLT